MTKLLFQDDCYLKEFEAKILEIHEDTVILNQTAFAYRGGGLQSDTGTITTSSGNRFELVEAYSKSGKIFHKLSPPPKYGFT